MSEDTNFQESSSPAVLSDSFVAFVLQGAEVPGHLRWVSSSTARNWLNQNPLFDLDIHLECQLFFCCSNFRGFDPSIDWPSDLKVSFFPNGMLHKPEASDKWA